MTTRRSALTQAMRAALVCCAGGLTATAHANLQENTMPSAAPTPSAVRTFFRGTPRLIGQHRFTYWGFEVYDATLWAGNAFDAQRYEQQRDELEEIFRDFRASPPMEPKLPDIRAPSAKLPYRVDQDRIALADKLQLARTRVIHIEEAHGLKRGDGVARQRLQ